MENTKAIYRICRYISRKRNKNASVKIVTRMYLKHMGNDDYKKINKVNDNTNNRYIFYLFNEFISGNL